MAGSPADDLEAAEAELARKMELTLPPELKAAATQQVVCPQCKAGDQMTYRQQISTEVTRVERKPGDSGGYRLTIGETFDATPISVYCRNCSWGDMDVRGDPWKDLVTSE